MKKEQYSQIDGVKFEFCYLGVVSGFRFQFTHLGDRSKMGARH
jgi:hypothetical protein